MTMIFGWKYNKEYLMKKKYTKKQITEAIAYWQKQLNESSLLTWQNAYNRLSSEPVPELNQDRIALVNDKCGNMIVPDTVTIGELYDTIKDYVKDDQINIEFFARV